MLRGTAAIRPSYFVTQAPESFMYFEPGLSLPMIFSPAMAPTCSTGTPFCVEICWYFSMRWALTDCTSDWMLAGALASTGATRPSGRSPTTPAARASSRASAIAGAENTIARASSRPLSNDLILRLVIAIAPLEQIGVVLQQRVDVAVHLDADLLLDLHVEIDHDRLVRRLDLHGRSAGRQGRGGDSAGQAGEQDARLAWWDFSHSGALYCSSFRRSSMIEGRR